MKALSRADKIGVAVHGPEVIDSGFARNVLGYLKRFGDVTAVLGGTMGRLAVIDAGLEDLINISPRRRPSQSIRDLQSDSGIIVILNQAKTRETGLAFGRRVAARAGASRPIIHIDCGGRFVAVFYGSLDEVMIAETASKDLGLDYIGPYLPDDNDSGSGVVVQDRGIKKRRLTGVRPGELISINGTVVAKAADSQVEVFARDGVVVEIKGAELKPHGLEKLSAVDLDDAIIRSGSIRRTEGRPAKLECKGSGAALIDHCAEDAFDVAEGTCIAVTVGDDTTAIAGDILYRLGIPIIGIVDGDVDGLSRKTSMSAGSVIIKVQPGFDDVVGRRIKEDLFCSKNAVDIKASELEERVLKIAGEHLIFIERV